MLQKIIYFLVLLSIAILQMYGLHKVGLQEYDSVKNYLIIKQIANGDFGNMFQHGSPTFFLFFASIYKIYPSALLLAYTNVGINVLAVAIFGHIFSKYFHYTFWQHCLYVLFAGTSLYVCYGTRSLAIESLSLLVFAISLYYFLEQKTKMMYYFWACIAILLTINYKILLFFPLIAIYEIHKIWKEQSFATAYQMYLRYAIILVIPFFFYILVGILFGVSWKSYPAHWFFVLIMRKNLNPWKNIQTIHWDIDYYFQYLQNFESPILLLGIAIFIILQAYFYAKKEMQQKKVSNILLVITVFTWIEMSILPKAPRGILFILPLCYFFAFDACLQIFQILQTKLQDKIYKNTMQLFSMSLYVLLIFYQYVQIQKYIYTYNYTNYPNLVAYLKQNQIDKIAVTVGINLQYFLPPSIDFQTILFEKDLEILQKQGYQYCLVDAYYKVVGADVLDVLQKKTTIISYEEGTLLSPLLYLEHCEFTGYTFEQALATQAQVKQNGRQLKLIKIQ
jgi:hypothetical protein